MATTTRSTKAKTKTSKNKVSTNKTTSTTAAKTTKTPVKSAKVVKAAEKPAANVSGKVGDVLGLRRLNIIAAVVFVLLAVAAALVMSAKSYQLTVGHWAKDEIASTQSTVFAPAVQAVYDVELRWVVVGTLLLSAILPLLYVTKLERRYTGYIRNTRMVPYRWFDLGITSALMVMAIALLSGVQDLFVLKLMADLVLVTCLLGLIAERQNNRSDKPVWSAFLTSIFTGIGPWKLIAAYAITTVVSGAVRAPWYVYALYASTLVGFTLLGLNQYRQYRRQGAWQDYAVVERNYLAISTLTKAAFAAILIVGVR